MPEYVHRELCSRRFWEQPITKGRGAPARLSKDSGKNQSRSAKIRSPVRTTYLYSSPPETTNGAFSLQSIKLLAESFPNNLPLSHHGHRYET